MTPLYVTDETYGTTVRNEDLYDIGEYPTMSLPVFNTVVDVKAYGNTQSLSPQQSARVASQLRSIDDQRKAILADSRYQGWLRRGFDVVPDLNQGRFVWVYTGGMANTGLSAYMHNINLACAACGGHKDEQPELVKLTHDHIVFDIYGKYGDEIYKGFYISRDGNVYAYNKSHDIPGAFEQTVIEQLPNLKVDVEQMERLMKLLASLPNAEIKYYRYDSGKLAYDGWIDGKRVIIYGDNNSKSLVADDLMQSLRTIISV